MCLSPSLAAIIAKNLLSNCGSVSDSTKSKRSNGTIQLSKNVTVMCVDDSLYVRMALASFE